jgi:serine/threonine protein kinase
MEDTTITTVTLPLTNFNIGSLLLLFLLAILGAVYLHKLLVRQSCVCHLCTSTYLIETEIGHGGFGKVFSVFHKSERSSSYVMKKIPVNNLNEANTALAEAKVLRALDHRNCVGYEDDFIHVELPHYGVSGLEPQLYVCIIMEKCTGGDLKEFIENSRDGKEAKYLENNVALKMLTEISSALEYCHAKNVVHRDIKPGNVFIHEDLGCRLGDFGLSRKWTAVSNTTGENDDVAPLPPSSKSLTTCGTEFYRPPELFNGTKGANYMKVDVWCLGLLFVELLTLEYVFEWDLGILGARVLNKGDTSLHTLLENIPKHFPSRIVTLCRKMLSSKPYDRPAAADIVKELAEIRDKI